MKIEGFESQPFYIETDDGWHEGDLIEAYIDDKEVPEGLHVYQIRHSDNNWSIPATLEKCVAVNYFGAFITEENLDGLFKETDYVDIFDWEYGEEE